MPSGHDPSAYETKRLFATAPDGEKVPVTVLYKRGTRLDGSAPCLPDGYGAYGISLPAAFSVAARWLVDRGRLHATARI